MLLAHAPWDLFHPCSWADPSTCQPDDGPQAGSSRTHAAICSPNKKTKAEPKAWSPDSTLPAKHPARDGLRSKHRMYVGFTPEKKYGGRSAASVDGVYYYCS